MSKLGTTTGNIPLELLLGDWVEFRRFVGIVFAASRTEVVFLCADAVPAEAANLMERVTKREYQRKQRQTEKKEHVSGTRVENLPVNA